MQVVFVALRAANEGDECGGGGTGGHTVTAATDAISTDATATATVTIASNNINTIHAISSRRRRRRRRRGRELCAQQTRTDESQQFKGGGACLVRAYVSEARLEEGRRR